MSNSNKLAVNFCGVDFKNPIIPASGAFGYGREFEHFYSCLLYTSPSPRD